MPLVVSQLHGFNVIAGSGGEPMTLAYGDTERSTFTLEWDYLDGATPGIVQTALSAGGPWYDYITPVPTPQQDIDMVMTVVVNNQFDAARWFRSRNAASDLFTVPVNPVASAVPLPDWAITNISAGRDLPVILPGVIYTPYSNQQNKFISTVPIYVEPLSRKEWQAGGPQIVTVANTPLGGSWKFTRNGSDPTPETFIPRLDSVDDNLSCGRCDFGMVVKIRNFSAGMKSPLAVIAVDKRFNLLPFFVTQGTGGSESAWCDYTRTDSFQTWVDGQLVYITWCSGQSCGAQVGTDGPCAGQDPELSVPAASGVSSSRDISVSSSYSLDSFRDGWPGKLMSVTGFQATTIAQFGRATSWNNIPVVCEYLEQDSTAGLPAFNQVTIAPEIGLAGPGGSITAAMPATEAYIAGPGGGTYDKYDYLLSVIDESGGEIASVTIPDPPAVPSVYGDDFEEYEDSSKLVTDTLDAGTGWLDAWTVRSSPIQLGYDFFLDTGDTDDDYTGGSGWEDAWTVTSGTSYGDNFEEYADGPVDSVAGALTGGTGWRVVDGFQVAWFGNNARIGLDDFQSYPDSADITGILPMTGGTGWGDITGWAVNE